MDSLLRRNEGPNHVKGDCGEQAGDHAFGFAFRVAAGIPTMADRARLDEGEEPGGSEPPEPPGFEGV
jgi:hypothetical protein